MYPISGAASRVLTGAMTAPILGMAYSSSKYRSLLNPRIATRSLGRTPASFQSTSDPRDAVGVLDDTRRLPSKIVDCPRGRICAARRNPWVRYMANPAYVPPHHKEVVAHRSRISAFRSSLGGDIVTLPARSREPVEFGCL